MLQGIQYSNCVASPIPRRTYNKGLWAICLKSGLCFSPYASMRCKLCKAAKQEWK